VIAERYEVQGKLARGGMAEVFIGQDTSLDRPVAIKVMFPEFAADTAFVERFRREAQAAANLTHPNIVAVYDWGPIDTTYFMVMEYVSGRTLAEIIREAAPIHPDRAADLASGVASALGFAHRNGVVHRDIKPANVIIDDAGEVKVADFGIARAVSGGAGDLTQTGTVMGTATYFSPEQAQGQDVDPRSDLYSLGVVLYEMTTGRPPFTGDSPVSIAYKHVQEPVPPPRSIVPAIPAGLQAITLKLLAKRTSNRYASAEDLRADLGRFRAGEPVLALQELEELRARRAAREADEATQGVAAVGAAALVAGADDATRVQSAVPAAAAGAAVGATAAGGAAGAGNPPPASGGSGWSTGAIVAVGAALLLGLAALLFALNGFLTDDGDTDLVTMPGVVGMTFEEAELRLVEEGFDRTNITRVPVEAQEGVAAGVVVGQQPLAARRVQPDTAISLEVTAEAELVEVPAVAGQTESDALITLDDAGFTRVIPQFAASDDVEEGRVIETRPPEGTEVDPTLRLVLVVSSGPADTAVPNLLTLTQEEANQALEAVGLVGDYQDREVEFGSDQVGLVVDQDPAANSEATRGDTVTVFMGVEGPAPTTTTTSTTTTTAAPTTTTTTVPATTTSTI
ncbi:MAG: Stk1 family PASTA domain-containing Ser/Thr kinase, partial [Acidimicrobiales bacterium]